MECTPSALSTPHTPLEPFVNGGRGSNGRFVAGNKGGPGNPHAAKVQAFRAAILADTTVEDVLEVIHSLQRGAKQGDIAAAKLFLDRVLGLVKHEISLSTPDQDT